MPDPAARRWFAISLVRLAGALGAVFGVVLAGRAESLEPKLLGVAIVVAALAMAWSVSQHLARRWRSRP